ncbi:hypothetical protein LEP1GSC036_2808 [Leptospira weilii str. 2006001853]|uniref:Uncharacterized protein n=2 Tax=Leptospira weilii TaxID=28184 RepID=A0A828Z675_9LEPT|nr:hypothetical protein LEP1GSC036_2808 [Leptospira weilii str. 2006001853]EMN44050.1 hypothetical protein LEP1GSC086_4307 [Leptospira weilii str. LNT 1234]QDK22839.1 hypothetical protein FHG67_09040 [Leptospira weilii]QDK27516.1 hypothetical protein FHG68_13190 [Leptospira weilii]
MHFREKQNRIPFYKYERPTLHEIRVLQSKNQPTLELYYIGENEKKFSYYCVTPSDTNDQKKDMYLYDVQFRKFEDTCEFKEEDSNWPIRVEKAERRLFLYDVGIVINDLPWWGKSDTSLTIYRGPHIRKKISDVREVWTIQQNPFDYKLCIADSNNRIVALDCSKHEEDLDLFKMRHVCISAEFNCSKQPNSKLLSLSEIPKSPPTYFSAQQGWALYYSRKNYAIWLSEATPTQTISPIVQIRFEPSFKKFSFKNVIEYGLIYFLYPFTIVFDLVATPTYFIYFTLAGPSHLF